MQFKDEVNVFCPAFQYNNISDILDWSFPKLILRPEQAKSKTRSMFLFQSCYCNHIYNIDIKYE